MMNSHDDSAINKTSKNSKSMSGYLSEGHMEFQGQYASIPNANLERSKLMRKSFHSSNRQLTVVVSKVAPPPPLRKTSALSNSQPVAKTSGACPATYMSSDLTSDNIKALQPFHQANLSNISTMSSNTSMSEDSCQTVITTCAVVHHEQTPPKTDGPGEPDEVDGRFNMDLPPYPSPPNSSCHSRQASEDFPPPPPSIDLEPLNEQLNQLHILESSRKQQHGAALDGGHQILYQLQQQKQQHLQQNRNSMANWLRDLQSKQQALRTTKPDMNQATVKDLASRFEGATAVPQERGEYPSQVSEGSGKTVTNSDTVSLSSVSSSTSSSSHKLSRLPPADQLNEISVDIVDCAPPSKRHEAYLTKPRYDIGQSQIAQELREVEMLNTLVQQTLNSGNVEKRSKKKSVSFCDQVILVATADEDEEDCFIPNPILERVLRSANGGSSDKQTDGTCGTESVQVGPIDPSPPSSDSGVDTVETPMGKTFYNNDVVNISQRGSGVPDDVKSSYYSMDPQRALQMKQQLQSTLNSQTNDMQRQLLMQQQENQKLSALLMHEQKQNHSNQARMSLMRNQLQFNPALDGSRKNMCSPSAHGVPPSNPRTPTCEVASPYMSVPSHGSYIHPQKIMSNANYPNVRQANMQYSPTVNVPLPSSSPIAHLNGLGYQKMPQSPNYNYPFNHNPLATTPQYLDLNGITPTEAVHHTQVYMQPPMMKPTTAAQAPMAMMHPPPQPQYFQQSTNGQVVQKKVSFDVGTKGPAEGGPTPTSKLSGMPYEMPPALANQYRLPNNNSNAQPTGKIGQCTLCRKKQVVSGPMMYCSDCDYYVSRYQSNHNMAQGAALQFGAGIEPTTGALRR